MFCMDFICSSEIFIYQLIYIYFMIKNARSPTLETIKMVEKEVKKDSGEFTKRELWQNLPKKVMWQTFVVIINYLEEINKIAFDKSHRIAYIWNPELTKKLMLRKEIKL